MSQPSLQHCHGQLFVQNKQIIERRLQVKLSLQNLTWYLSIFLVPLKKKLLLNNKKSLKTSEKRKQLEDF